MGEHPRITAPAAVAPQSGLDPQLPPRYLGSLIGSINDAAKSAQTSALFLAFVGLYLGAMAISVTDEDLLRGVSIQLSQLGGVSVPVIVTFFLGPILFLTLHAQLLSRYRKVVLSVGLFLTELRAGCADASDRARCRELLANIDLVLMMVGRGDPGASSWIYRAGVFATIAVIPVVVLIAVQVSFLRYQSAWITLTQQVIVILDLWVLVIFYYWLWRHEILREAPPEPAGRRRVRRALARAALYALMPAALCVVSLVYLRVPDADAETVRFWDLSDARREQPLWARWAEQPLDLVLCPQIHWGCRYLNLSNRTLVERGSEGNVRAVRSGSDDLRAQLGAIDGLSARNRVLRFANFNESRAYRIDLIGADVRGATFWDATLQGGKLAYAQLQGANLEKAGLQYADLYRADLRGANLARANMQGAKLQEANLQGADLRAADLSGANLFGARLQGADLENARLQNADLRRAGVRGASFRYATCELADVTDIDPKTDISPPDKNELMHFVDSTVADRRDQLAARLGGADAVDITQVCTKADRPRDHVALIRRLAATDPESAVVLVQTIIDGASDRESARHAVHKTVAGCLRAILSSGDTLDLPPPLIARLKTVGGADGKACE